MFTLYLNLDACEFPIERICLLQFASALSCVRSILENPGYEVGRYCIIIIFHFSFNVNLEYGYQN